MTKGERMVELARRRRAARWPGYAQVGDYCGGAYESDDVSPFSRSAGNLDADVFLLLQDWSSSEFLSKPIDDEVRALGHKPGLRTNINLKKLLLEHFSLELRDCFGTNLFPFIKQGSLKVDIPTADMTRAAVEYALPQIEIVRPRLVVCLGLSTFGALQRATGRKPSASMDAAIAAPFDHGVSRVWCQAHPGQQGQNMRNRGNKNRTDDDWRRMTAAVALTRGATLTP